MQVFFIKDECFCGFTDSGTVVLLYKHQTATGGVCETGFVMLVYSQVVEVMNNKNS